RLNLVNQAVLRLDRVHRLNLVNQAVLRLDRVHRLALKQKIVLRLALREEQIRLALQVHHHPIEVDQEIEVAEVDNTQV
ncbi:MAG: hypothetical protein QM660_07430, partial [Dysgonomonas sp.]